MRVFVALPIPTGLRKGIEAVQADVRSRLPKRSAKWIPADQQHLTIHFLGETKPDSLPVLTRQLNEICRRYAPFDLRFSRLGVFPDLDHPRVLWLGLAEAPELKRLQTEVSKTIGLHGSYGESRTYHPHVTLARLRNPNRLTVDNLRQPLSGETIVAGPNWRPASVCVYQRPSNTAGSPYIVAAECPLGNWKGSRPDNSNHTPTRA